MAWTPNMPQTSQQKLEEIKILLESKLSDLQSQLHQFRCSEVNNPIDLMTKENLEQTKKLLIQTLTEKVTPQPPDFNRSGELLFKAVLEKLEVQLKETTRMIDSEKRVLNKLNEKIQSLQEQCESFDNIMSARHESGEMNQAENLDQIEKQLKAELRKHQKAVKYVLQTVYRGDQNRQQIIADLLQSYIDNPGDYIELSVEDYKTAARFFQIGLITRHPYEPMKVRLS